MTDNLSKELQQFLIASYKKNHFADVQGQSDEFLNISTGDYAGFANNPDINDIPKTENNTFSTTLLKFIDRSGKSDPEIYKAAGISRQHFSRIRSDQYYKPKKETIFALCIALQLNEKDSNILLNYAGYSFSTCYYLDIIVLFCIKKEIYNPYVVNELLVSKGLEPLIIVQ